MSAIAKDMAEYVKKRYEEFMGEQISKWVAEELKKMGYPKKKEKQMQEIEYEDGTKTKEFFGSMFEALDDSKAKAAKKAIKKVMITKTTVKKREK